VTPTPVATFADPFAYCAAVGTIDSPDARYTGPELPDVIAEGLRDAYNATDVALEVFARGSFWRCMEGEVYACTIGANLPCLSKGDRSTVPTAAMADFCKSNLGSDYIPAVVTGRATIFSWRCAGETPVVDDQYTEIDGQGYLEFVWHRLAPPN
jgi:hypothetical protein